MLYNFPHIFLSTNVVLAVERSVWVELRWRTVSSDLLLSFSQGGQVHAINSLHSLKQQTVNSTRTFCRRVCSEENDMFGYPQFPLFCPDP